MSSEDNEIINKIADMLCLNSNLHPFLFNSDNKMLANVREHLLMICEHAKKIAFPFFSEIEQIDILLGGSICSYTWNDTSDLDIFIITSNILPENTALRNHIFNYISRYFTNKLWKPSIYGHSVDIGVLPLDKFMNYYEGKNAPSELYSYETYSITNDKWISPPLKADYPFTVEDVYKNYLKMSEDIQDFTDNLEKTNNGFLTMESQGKLRNKIANIKREAFLAKEHDDLHEYTLTYNTFRACKKLKLFDLYYRFINDSFNNLFGGK